MTYLENPNKLEVFSAVTPTRVRWSGIFAGTLAATVTYLALMVLGFAIGIANVPNADSVGSVAIPTAIWTVVALAASAFLGGTTAARAVGLHGHSRGRFNGLITGMVLLSLLTLGTSSLLSSAIRSVLGLAGGVVSTASSAIGSAAGAVGNAAGNAANNAGGVQGLLDNLGLGNAYQAVTSGLNENELSQLISDAEPALTPVQVKAAADTVGNVVRNAGRNITQNLNNLSDIGGIVTRQVDGVTQALSGPEFVARLQSRGLSQAQAQEVAKVVNTRVAELKTQGQQAADAIAKTTKDATQTAANTASSVAWIWLLAAGVTLGMATLGGGRGKDENENIVVDPANDASKTRRV